MTYVNEFISQEDLDKYGVREILKKYAFEDMNPEMGRKWSWTVDREKNIFFIHIKNGRYETSDQSGYVIGWKGEFVWVTLSREGGGQDPETKVEYKVWGLVDISFFKESNANMNDVIRELKEILTAYKELGAWTEVNHFDVKFLF